MARYTSPAAPTLRAAAHTFEQALLRIDAATIAHETAKALCENDGDYDAANDAALELANAHARAHEALRTARVLLANDRAVG